MGFYKSSPTHKHIHTQALAHNHIIEMCCVCEEEENNQHNRTLAPGLLSQHREPSTGTIDVCRAIEIEFFKANDSETQKNKVAAKWYLFVLAVSSPGMCDVPHTQTHICFEIKRNDFCSLCTRVHVHITTMGSRCDEMRRREICSGITLVRHSLSFQIATHTHTQARPKVSARSQRASKGSSQSLKKQTKTWLTDGEKGEWREQSGKKLFI